MLGWLTLRGIAWEDVLAAVKVLDWRLLVLALTAVMFAGFLQAYRWKLLLAKEPVSIARLFMVREMGQGLNNVSPVRILSEFAQTAMLTHGNGIKASSVVSSILITRLFDLLVTVNLVGAGLIVLPQLSGFRPVVAPLWGMAVVAMVAFLLVGHRVHRLPIVRRVRPLEETLRSISAVRTRLGALGMGVAVTALSWMSIGTAAWLVAQAAGIELPFWLMSIVIVGVSLFGSAIPAPPGMVGVYEFVAVSTLGLFAVDPTAALTFALVIHGVIFLPPIIIGIPALIFERRTIGGVMATAGAAIQRTSRWGMKHTPSPSRTAPGWSAPIATS